MSNFMSFIGGFAQQANKDIAAHNKLQNDIKMASYEQSLEAWQEREKVYNTYKQAYETGQLPGVIAKSYGGWDKMTKEQQEATINWFSDSKQVEGMLKKMKPGEKPNYNTYQHFLKKHPMVEEIHSALGVKPNTAYARANELRVVAEQEAAAQEKFQMPVGDKDEELDPFAGMPELEGWLANTKKINKAKAEGNFDPNSPEGKAWVTGVRTSIGALTKKATIPYEYVDEKGRLVKGRLWADTGGQYIEAKRRIKYRAPSRGEKTRATEALMSYNEQLDKRNQESPLRDWSSDISLEQQGDLISRVATVARYLVETGQADAEYAMPEAIKNVEEAMVREGGNKWLLQPDVVFYEKYRLDEAPTELMLKVNGGLAGDIATGQINPQQMPEVDTPTQEQMKAEVTLHIDSQGEDVMWIRNNAGQYRTITPAMRSEMEASDNPVHKKMLKEMMTPEEAKKLLIKEGGLR